MATIEEMQQKMTIYFSKKTGEIKQITGGINDMSVFGNNSEDFSMIWDFIILDKDIYVVSNSNNFVYDLESKQLKIKQDALPKYPVA